MTTPLLYTAELDLAAEDVEPFLQWYAFRHAPDLFQAGFLTCACYLSADGDMNLFDLYEIPSWTVFERQRYLGIRGRDPYVSAVMVKRRNKAHTVYDQLLIAPDASGPSLDTEWIKVFRFAVEEEADDAIVGALRRHQPLGAASGLTRLRYAVRGQDHPRNPTFRPRCMVVTEWAAPPPEACGIAEILHTTVGEALTKTTVFTGRRLYPWGDRPR